MRRALFCLTILFFFTLFTLKQPSLALAGRTCCEERYLSNGAVDPAGCNGCTEGIDTKNYGDSCGSVPYPSCQMCPASRPIANACGGGGSTPNPTAPPTAPPPVCTCEAWKPAECGAAGGCPVGQRRLMRTCSPAGCQTQSMCQADPTCSVTVTSTIQTDPSLAGKAPPQRIGGFGGGYCISADPGTPISTGSISAKDAAGKVTNGTISSGIYKISNLDPKTNEYTITYDPLNPNLTCTCPAGCVYTGKSAPTVEDLKFFVSPMGTSWFQTMGGDIGAFASSGTSIRNRIPDTCTEPWCQPYLSLPTSPTQLQTVGAVITNRGASIDLQEQAGTQEYYVGPSGINRIAKLPTSLVCRENYDYFYRLYSMGASPTIDFANSADARKPTVPPLNGKPAYYYQGSVPLTIDSAWQVSGNESIVVFVKGNLVIKNTIKVANGAFLSFIVSGSITIDPSVGTTDFTSVSGVVQGVYIANGNIVVNSTGAAGTDLKFVGEGIFATCGSVRLPRDYKNGGNGLQNNKVPASLFVYRPDFVQNTPSRMKESRINWQEVAP